MVAHQDILIALPRFVGQSACKILVTFGEGIPIDDHVGHLVVSTIQFW